MNTAFRMCLFVLMLAASNFTARAGITVPLHIGTTNAIVNQFGQTLPGSDSAAALFGQPVVAGDLVQIIRTQDGSISPPDAGGNPTGTNNVVISTAYVGQGVDPAVGQIGQFGLSLPDYDGSSIFCRVFNAHDLASASFYGDSQVYNPGAGYSVFTPVVTAVHLLDANVTDPSGLNNSWIKLLGGVPTNFPGANGGATYANFINGVTPGNLSSFVEMTQVLPDLDGNMIVYWYSLTGQVYQVEYAANLNSGDYAAVGSPVTATDWVSQITHAGSTAGTNASYRVKLLLNP